MNWNSAQVVPRSPDRGTRLTVGLREARETYGRASEPVGRPAHNRLELIPPAEDELEQE